MNHVWLVTMSTSIGETYVVGVYSSKKKALIAAKNILQGVKYAVVYDVAVGARLTARNQDDWMDVRINKRPVA